MNLGVVVLIVSGFWIIASLIWSVFTAFKERKRLKSAAVPIHESKILLDQLHALSSISQLGQAPTITESSEIIINQNQISTGAIATLEIREIAALFHFTKISTKRFLMLETLNVLSLLAIMLGVLIISERSDPIYEARFNTFIVITLLVFIVHLWVIKERYLSSTRLGNLSDLLRTLPDKDSARTGIAKLLAADPETNFPRAKEINAILNRTP